MIPGSRCSFVTPSSHIFRNMFNQECSGKKKRKVNYKIRGGGGGGGVDVLVIINSINKAQCADSNNEIDNNQF